MQMIEPSARNLGEAGHASDGLAFLVEEKRPKLSIEICEKFAEDGSNFMLVSRDPPSHVTDGTALEPRNSIWLTYMVGKDRMNPTAIGILMGEIKKFLEQNDRSVVLIDGLEYLISINTFDRMLQFVHQLRDVIVMSGAKMVIPIDTRTLGDREIALLERNLQVVIPGSRENDMIENLLQVPSREAIGLSNR